MPSVLRIKNPDGTWYEVTALKGDTGITPNLQVGTVTTGNPGTSAEVTITGTPEEPVLNFKIPKGEPGTGGGGSGTVSYINHKGPDDAGNVALAAEDIGARPDTWTPTASDVNAVPTTRKVNDKPLSSDITLIASDVGALGKDDTAADSSKLGGHDPSHYATTEDIQQIRTEIPTELPNPKALTINGQSYDGSAAVNITITGGDGGANIDDTTPSTSTTYSSQKIEGELSALNEANAAQNTEINKKANNADLAKVAKSGSYDDLTAKPKIPTVPTTLPNPNALTFTGAVNDTYDGSVSKSVAIPVVPEALKNPNKLILSGAVTAEYDGSTEVSVNIPAGSVKTVAGVSPDEAGNVPLTAENVGAGSIDLLWAQDNVTRFAAQTIDLDLSAYNAVRIEYAASTVTTQSGLRITKEARIGTGCILSFVSGYNDKIHTRTAVVSVSKIVFNGANVSSSTSVETSCIPTRIWGVKWGVVDDFSA